MKKFLCVFLLALIFLVGCSTQIPKIEDYTFEMEIIQGFDDGRVLYCSPTLTNIHEQAEEMILTCKAENGVLTLHDATNNKSYSGTYSKYQTSPESIIYEITMGNSKGFIVVAMTTYADKTQIPTLIITINDYALNFKAK